MSSPSSSHGVDTSHKEALGTLALGALGVVYGDIGTSPLYAIRESLHAAHGLSHGPDEIKGIISLVFWSLMVVICVKYLFLILRADHHGEGGILALTALVSGTKAKERWHFPILVTLGLFGTALLYGDGIITPAISVLSAVEGLEYITPAAKQFVLPITVTILVALFSLQYRGTHSVGQVFGPIMVLWFATLAALGIRQALQVPEIFNALSPHYAVHFVLTHGHLGFIVLGSIFLVVTGGEALYADMGHFGRKPIQLAWFGLAFPALMLNYLGQGALLLSNPKAIENPFFYLAPEGPLRIGLVILATAATVIASQALISGVYSLSMQAVQMGYLPRLVIQHTSPNEKGQIYVPAINWALMLACLGLVLGFRSSANLAAAYGVAVTATMVITTLLFWTYLIDGWRWPWWRAGIICGFFLCVELVFLTANALKIPQGGWFPLLVGYLLFVVMSTWKRGRQIVFALLQSRTRPLQEVITTTLPVEAPARVPGVAIYMYGNREGCPPALLANLRHNHALHEKVVVLSVTTADQPYVWSSERSQVTALEDGFWRVNLCYGFLEQPNVFATLHGLVMGEDKLDPNQATFFLGRETVIPRRDRRSEMSHWQEMLFAYMTRNALDATNFFQIPPDRVVELGTQLEI